MSSLVFDCDLIIVGGGSGGISAAKQAAQLGVKVAVFDFVKPTSHGTTWGLGGTSVNVGSIPKKLFHFTSLLGDSINDAEKMGWDVHKGNHSWPALVKAISSHIKMLNFRLRAGLKNKGVNYINSWVEIMDDHNVTYTTKTKGTTEIKTMSAKYILIAVGARPFIPQSIPGAIEHGITSDDIFYLKSSPGKSLCIGGSYVALECAGFLNSLGHDVTVASRSVLLRGFDRQCVNKVSTLMSDTGTRFLTDTTVMSISKLSSGELEVLFRSSSGTETSETFQTVIVGTGRVPNLTGLGPYVSNITTESSSGKIIVDDAHCTNIPSIFAIGDVCEGKSALASVASKAGELLAQRLFGGSTAVFDYDLVPTAVFTPFEYSCVGLSEESANAIYGEHNIEVYIYESTPLELSAVHRTKHSRFGEEVDMGYCSLSKLICLKTENERVIGFHCVGVNAAEITQGYVLALKLGATKAHFDSLIGIHPTSAELFCSLKVTRRSGASWGAEGTCENGACSL